MTANRVLLLLPYLLRQVRRSKTLEELQKDKIGIERSVNNILHGETELHAYPEGYVPELFFLYGVTFAKEIFLIEQELKTALQKDLSTKNELMRKFHISLAGEKASLNEVDLIEQVSKNTSHGIGNALSGILGNTWTFFERIRSQGYYKTWGMLHELAKLDIRIRDFIPALTEFIRGVHVTVNYTGDRTLSPEQAWEILLPSITVAVECEIDFIRSYKYSVFGKFSRTLMKAPLFDEPYTRQTLIYQRLAAIILRKFEQHEDVVKVIKTTVSYFKYFGMDSPTLQESAAQAIRTIKAELADRKEEASRYRFVIALVNQIE